MTNNLERILGEGGFRMVYCGLTNNVQVAVKLLSQASRQGYQHLHLTMGHLNEGDHLGLIYEFMADGNLAEHLSGLEYLHDGCKPPIIHRDVKTTMQILVYPKAFKQRHPYVHHSCWHYCFGVALLEIISCKPVRPLTDTDIHIIKWVNSLPVPGDINGIIDRRLNGNYDVNSVWKAVEIAMNCVSKKPTRRPTMNQVVAELKNCLAMELEGMPENEASNSMSIVMDYSVSRPMAR
ncbi:unnamed protein product [Citrullus colocynthis]|uniref:Protein kinase domain-containing protein n=1 Tax=Citrullus colocynthis TaxID=252529 RepID=A0ABP0XVU0_9ROSI